MTLGEKIKKYRVNKGLTQKALGERALGQKGDKALRIYKYENDVIVPKPDVRRSIADALDVDVEALSDIAITSNEDIMYILFELEETKGLRIHKENGHIVLDFDDQELKNNEQLFTYLSLWADESSRNKTTVADKNAYEHWKGRFVTNANDFSYKENEINAYYSSIMERINCSSEHMKSTSDIVVLLRNIIEAGRYVDVDSDKYGIYITFKIDEMIETVSESISLLYGKMLSEMQYFVELGAPCRSEILFRQGVYYVTYIIPIPSFSGIKNRIDKFQDYYQNEKTETERDQFERVFKHDLEYSNNVIADEIAFYYPK